MVVALLPLDRHTQARALRHHLLRHGDFAGHDAAGRTVITLAVDPWTLDQLLSFDAASEDLEDSDGEAEPDDEIDGPPVLSVAGSSSLLSQLRINAGWRAPATAALEPAP